MAGITLLDGGMGQEMIARSGDEPTPLWATRVMIDHPGMVRELTHRTDLTPARHAEFALGWVGMGATIVGGCCEVGPAHIRHLHDTLSAAGHRIA